MSALPYPFDFRKTVRDQIDLSGLDRYKILGQKGGDLAASVIGDLAMGKSLGESLINTASGTVGKWAVGQLLGSAAAAGPIGLIGGMFLGGQLSRIVGGWFKRRPKDVTPAKRTVISNSPYDVLATEMPKQQAQLQNQLVREVMGNIRSAFGGNRLAATQAQQSAAQTIAGLLPQFTQQRMQSMLGLSELAARDRSEKRRIGAELLANQMQLQQQAALARQQQQSALSTALISAVLSEALGKK